MATAADPYDVVYLGGGTGGYVSAIRASQLGLRTAMVEKYRVGGTCLHWGCIPSKTLLQSAKVLDSARHAATFGVEITGEIKLDYGKVQQRREQVVGGLYRGVQALLRAAKCEVISGEGRLVSPTDVAVKTADGEQTVRGKNVVINTGSRPRELPGVPFDGERVISSDHAVALPKLPSSVVIVGAGAIGVEFATFYHSVGVPVTLVELLPSLVPLEDADVGAELEKIFARQGIQAHSGARRSSVATTDAGVRVTVETRDGTTVDLDAESVLVAIGRTPNSENVGLERTGVKLERGFVVVNERMETGVPHLYAIGDVTGHYLLAHKAMHEGIVAAEAIAGQSPEPIDYNRVPRCTYSQPQIASVGLSEAEAVRQEHSVKVGKFPFRVNSKATIEGYTEGFAKIVGDADTGEILGVHLIGSTVTELIDAPTIAKLLESTTVELGLSIHAHPTLSEIIGEAALAADGMAIHLPAPAGSRATAVKA